MKMTTQTERLVVVRTRHEKAGKDRNLYFLFTASQVEDVLHEILVQPVPFAPPFLQGMVLWRGHVTPVVDIGKRFCFSDNNEASAHSYLVIRMGARGNTSEKQIFRCVLRVPDQIKTIEFPDSNSIFNSDRIGVESSLIRGAFQQDDDIFIVPDIVSILQNQQNIDI